MAINKVIESISKEVVYLFSTGEEKIGIAGNVVHNLSFSIYGFQLLLHGFLKQVYLETYGSGTN